MPYKQEDQKAQKAGTSQNSWEFRGFSSPTTTPVPDEIFDVLAPRLKEGELRVLLYIIRRTFGWKKTSDNISLSQMVNGITTREGQVLDEGTGLSKRAVVQAVRSLIAHKVIVATQNQSAAKGFEATTYSLNVSQTPSNRPPLYTKATRASQFKRPPLYTKVTRASYLSKQALVTLVHIQQTVKQHVKNDGAVLHELSVRGVDKDISLRLTKKYPPEYIRQKIQLHDSLVKNHSPLISRNPAGFLRRAIEQDYQPPADLNGRDSSAASSNPVSRQGSPTASSSPASRQGSPTASGNAVGRQGSPAASGNPVSRQGSPAASGSPASRQGSPTTSGNPMHWHGAPTATGSPVARENALVSQDTGNDYASGTTKGGAGSDAVWEYWEQAKAELQRAMPNATYMTYLHNSVLLDIKDGQAILGVTSEKNREWIQNRLALRICRVLGGVTGESVTLRAVGLGEGVPLCAS